MIVATVRGIELKLETAPGLFSPRAVDLGTLAMLSRVEFGPDDKVLDLGCGYGVVGLVAARLVRPERVWLLDKDPAAVEAAAANLAANGAAGASVVLSDGFRQFAETGFDKILCNPPYQADFAVPKHFIEKGFNRLVVGGSLFMVTKRELWYRNKITSVFGGVKVREVDGYFVFEATKKTSQYAAKRPG
ncbi:MAG TPA: methyltransferase [Caulobacteraceae bacterium]|jgi:16S rRNA (guanine1207-N2)-methyltransferase|nr:methyltransferase [Caulobacteraceae bacterium]